MATLFAVNYDGLRPKGSYEEIIDKLAAGRPELRQPDRRAKFLRESPQIANLLDGEGSLSFLEMAQQQLAAASHQAVEQRVLEVASEPGAAPAQALRALSLATEGRSAPSGRVGRSPTGSVPEFRSAGAQTAVINSSSAQTQAGVGTSEAETQSTQAQTSSSAAQTDAPRSGGGFAPQTQFFDIGHDERMDSDLQELNATLDAQEGVESQKKARVASMVARHLGEEIDAQLPFAAQVARAFVPTLEARQSASAASSSSASAAAMTPAQQAFASRMGEQSQQSSQGGTPESSGRQLVSGAAQAPAPKAKAKAEPKAKSRARTGPRPAVGLTDSGGAQSGATGGYPQVTAGQSASSPSAPAAGTGEAGGPVAMILGKSKEWWLGPSQNAEFLRRQAEAARGYPFTPEELRKGGTGQGKGKEGMMTKKDFARVVIKAQNL